jgi:hypothetical protein
VNVAGLVIAGLGTLAVQSRLTGRRSARRTAQRIE